MAVATAAAVSMATSVAVAAAASASVADDVLFFVPCFVVCPLKKRTIATTSRSVNTSVVAAV